MKRLLISAVAFALGMLLGSGASVFAGDSACRMNCHKCVESCDTNAKKQVHKKGDPDLIKKLQDCAKACKSYNGGAGKNMAECQQACTACAEACEKSGDASLASCAKYCRTCAESCSK